MKNIFVSCVAVVLVLAAVMPVPSRAQTTEELIEEIFTRIESDLSSLYCLYFDTCDDSMAKRGGRMGISSIDQLNMRNRQNFNGLKKKILAGAGKN